MNEDNQMDRLLEIQKSLKALNAKPFVLVVDDDENDLFLTREKLKSHGVFSRTASTVHDALVELEESAIWVVFLDWKMDSDLSGPQVLRAIKKACPKAVVIVLTGWASPEVSTASFANGAAAIMPKPLEDEQVKLIFSTP